MAGKSGIPEADIPVHNDMSKSTFYSAPDSHAVLKMVTREGKIGTEKAQSLLQCFANWGVAMP